VVGILDEDLPAPVLLARPSLYAVVTNPISRKSLLGLLLISVWQSLACYFSTRWTMESENLQATGVVCYIACVYMVMIQIWLWSHTLNIVSISAYVANTLIIPLVSYIYMAEFSASMKADLEGSLSSLFPWLGALVSIIAGLLPGFLVQYVRNRFFPTKHRLVQEKLYA
jgi:hypothetical protein